ncbi:ABC transporter ATP-binding protein [soil metagenome]
MAQVSLVNVSRVFGSTRAVDDLSMEIPSGAFVSLLGPSGCGKSTTLNLIAGLEKVDQGKIMLQNHDITKWAPHERQMAMVFQNYALYPHMDVFGNLAFSLKLAKKSKSEIEERVKRVAESLEIGELLQRRVGQLSGGQQQRVALARALVKEPRVFLFDEPLSNLDATLRTRTRIEIKKLHQQVHATSIFVTHDQEEAMMLSDLIAVMNKGKVVQLGSPNEIYRRPKNTYVAAFVGKPQMNFLDVTTSHDNDRFWANTASIRLSWPASDVQLPRLSGATPLKIGIRAEHVRLLPMDATSPSSVVGTISLIEPLGADSFIEVALENGTAITCRIDPDLTVTLGDLVRIDLPAESLHLFDAQTGDRMNT